MEKSFDAVEEYLKAERESIIEEILTEKKEIGFEEGQEPTDFMDEINAMAYETKAEAWFAGWDKAIGKVVEIINARNP